MKYLSGFSFVHFVVEANPLNRFGKVRVWHCNFAALHDVLFIVDVSPLLGETI